MNETEELRIAIRAVELYEKRHPRPSHVTQTQAAEMLGVTPRTVYNLLRVGRLKLNGLGRIPVSQVDLLLAEQSA